MAKSLSENMKDAGRAISDAAQNVGEKIADGTEKAVQAVKETTGIGGPAEGDNVGIAGVRAHMPVIACCGTTVGVVDGVEGSTIKLTRKDSPDGQHHFIPMSSVQRVDTHVHLKTNSMETRRDWKSDASSCGCGH